MYVVDKERFMNLVKNSEWSLNTLCKFVGIIPAKIAAHNALSYETISKLSFLLDASIEDLTGDESGVGLHPQVSSYDFGSINGKKFAKYFDEADYDAIAHTIGMPVLRFKETMEGKFNVTDEMSRLLYDFAVEYGSYQKQKCTSVAENSYDRYKDSSGAGQHMENPNYYNPNMSTISVTTRQLESDLKLVNEITDRVNRLKTIESIRYVADYCNAVKNIKELEHRLDKGGC